MIRRLIPHPVMSVMLTLMWMVLTRFSAGNLVLGMGLALFAGWTLDALQPQRRPMRGLRVMPRLLFTIFIDVIRSNAVVARLLLVERRSASRSSCFLSVHVALRDPTGLAVLALILTATPGTAWVEYVSEGGQLTLHIFDGAERDYYLHVINKVYVPMLQEIFE